MFNTTPKNFHCRIRVSVSLLIVLSALLTSVPGFSTPRQTWICRRPAPQWFSLVTGNVQSWVPTRQCFTLKSGVKAIGRVCIVLGFFAGWRTVKVYFDNAYLTGACRFKDAGSGSYGGHQEENGTYCYTHCKAFARWDYLPPDSSDPNLDSLTKSSPITCDNYPGNCRATEEGQCVSRCCNDAFNKYSGIGHAWYPCMASNPELSRFGPRGKCGHLTVDTDRKFPEEKGWYWKQPLSDWGVVCFVALSTGVVLWFVIPERCLSTPADGDLDLHQLVGDTEAGNL